MLLTDVIAKAPAIYAPNPIPGVSSRYEFLPTSKIVEHLMDGGYSIRKVDQRNSRKIEKRPYAKHLIHFRKEGEVQVGDVFPEGILINSHDKTTGLQFRMGFFRFVCANGLIIGDSVMPAIKFRHNNNNPIDLVLDRIDNQWKYFNDVMPLVTDMRQKILDEYHTHEFAHRVNMEFFEDRLLQPVVDLLKIRRWDDSATNLWTIYNRIQENVFKGGMKIPNEIEGTKRKVRNPIRNSRAITSIDKNVDFNKRLWDMAVDYLEA